MAAGGQHQPVDGVVVEQPIELAPRGSVQQHLPRGGDPVGIALAVAVGDPQVGDPAPASTAATAPSRPNPAAR
ncbi:MAG: hypothetical protein ACRDTE_30240 [Pseudonocardiaceae bacterium]